ncbi:MAG: Agmatine deiminase [Chthoniobacteraceae bacterium]|nr:Agmatine deiminase [Chthoniobacteraceae bacterium]
MTPAQLGYRMPAEWEPHTATWLSWPRRAGISFPGAYDKVTPTLAKMVHALAGSELVNINVCDAAHEADVRKQLSKARAKMDHVTFFHIPTNEPWCRDHGPIFLTRDEAPKLAILDWDYNAWGWKYPPFDDDDVVPTMIGNKLDLPIYSPQMVLEGGSIDVNGSGTLLTTRSCLLNPNRNPDLNEKEIEQRLRDFLGVKNILWLGDGIEGDDTDGHIDDITRFVDRTTVVTVVEEDSNDANYEPLRANLELLKTMDAEDGDPLQVLTLPMPSKIMRDGQRLPASYANFYIGNKVVLLPVFADSNDRWAIAVLEKVFPTRKVIPIDCRELIWGLGAFHCLTQQQPAIPA